MNHKKKTAKIIIIVIFIIFLVGLLGGYILLNFKAWVAVKRIEEVEDYAKTVEQLTIPDSAQIIALGEAAHGNKEFQELKLSVLKELVEKYEVKSFALETDFGEGVAVNEYIHGGDGTAENAVNNLSFTIYQTQQMIALVTWMREYNDNVPDGEKLSFYGFDLQNPRTDVEYVKRYLDKTKAIHDFNETDTLNVLLKEDISLSDESTQNAVRMLKTVKVELENNREKYIENSDQREYELALHCVDNILYCVDLFSIDLNEYGSYNNKRDELMAQNVMWILEHEQEKENARIMIAGHNGHIAKAGGYYTSMGDNLNQKYGDRYLAIGTDYFNTTDNIANNSGRGNYSFCSADPLAAQAKFMDTQTYYLDFNQIDSNSKIYSMIHSKMSMGSLGEGYSFLMRFINYSHRISETPAKLYDGMIFVYSANPIEIIEK